MPTSSQPTNGLKTLDLDYKRIKMLREILIDEMKDEIGLNHMTVEYMRLVEMRLQTLIMSNLTDTDDIKKEIKAPKVHV